MADQLSDAAYQSRAVLLTALEGAVLLLALWEGGKLMAGHSKAAQS